MLISFVIVALLLQLSTTQDSITFSPSTPLCIGEEVQMICFVTPPTAQPFIDSAALIFFNDSAAATIPNINDNALAGIDASRYSTDITGLTISTDRPGIRLNITNYQASDRATNFSCHGLYGGAGGPSPAIISGYPPRLAAPPSPSVSLTADYNSPTCSGTVQLAWTPGASDRDIEMYFLSLNGVLIAILGPSMRNYTDMLVLQRDMEYTYSVVTVSCAGYSTETPATSISVGPVVLAPSSLSIQSNISQGSSIFVSIQHDLSTVDRPDTLLYSLTLDMNGTGVESLNLLTPAEAISTPFSTKFTLDTYYHISVTADNCAGGSETVSSQTFVLLGLRTDNGIFQISSSNSSRIEWTYTNLDTPAGGFVQDYLSEDYFTFTIDNEAITEFSLYLPQRFDFALPPGYDKSTRQGVLQISFNGELFANVTVVVEQTLDVPVHSSLTILLGLFLVLLIILLCVVVVTVVCVMQKMKRVKSSYFV